MTPQERQLVDELFDKLARLEGTPQDRDAVRVIAGGLQRAPNALYPLVQTVLVQDEALKRADARIRELSGEDAGAPQEGGGFLDTMRNAIMGGGAARGSVPSVRSSGPDTRWNTGGTTGAYAQQQPAQAAPAPQVGSGSSFLGTAAASAAGVIGGAMLMNSISSMFGNRGGSGQAFAGEQSSGSPWSDSSSNSDLARDAGVNDIGAGRGGNDRSAGLFGSGDDDNDSDVDVADSGDFGDDGGGDTA